MLAMSRIGADIPTAPGVGRDGRIGCSVLTQHHGRSLWSYVPVRQPGDVRTSGVRYAQQRPESEADAMLPWLWLTLSTRAHVVLLAGSR